MPKIIITDGPGTGKEYEIAQAAILGRLDSNDIPVHDSKCSREHAKIYKQGARYAIVDLNSSNGTYVNGQRITKQMIEPGDEITIGAVAMRFEDPEAEAAQAAKVAGRKGLDDDFSGKAKPAAPSGPSADIVLSSHQPLQFRKVKASRSPMGFDLDQMSDVGRLIMYIGLILVFAGLMYLGYMVVTP